MKLTAEQMELAQSCSTPEELIEKAAAEGLQVSPEEANSFLNSQKMVELDEADVNLVAGGCATTYQTTCHYCGRRFDYKLTPVEYETVDLGQQWETTYIYVCSDCLK